MATAFVHAAGDPAARRKPDRTLGRTPRTSPVVQVHRIVGAVVLIPEGVLDASALQAVDDAVDAAAAITVIVDLSACALTHTAVLVRLGARRWARSTKEVRVVCPRRSARQLLARAGVASRLSLFRSIEEAVAVDGA